jgi:hypothetical protein
MPPRTKRQQTASPPPPPPAPERDYLVIFEEPDPYGLPADDTLVLDIEQPNMARPEVDVQQKVAIELTNTTSRVGTLGIWTTGAGGLLGAVLMVLFALLYPHDLIGEGSHGTMRAMILASVLSLVLMVAGTMLTHYGRRIQARGRLSDVRIIEKAPHSKAHLE